MTSRPPDGSGAAAPFYRMTGKGNSLRFADLARDDLRWCRKLQNDGWLAWDGTRWAPDETERSMEIAGRVGDAWRADAGRLPRGKESDRLRVAMLEWADGTDGLNGHTSCLRMGRRHLAVPLADLDAQPLLFNTRSLTIDLETGGRRAARPGDLLTQRASFDIGDAVCPTWDRFLADVTGGDADLAAFLQRAAGYSLTGSCKEQCFFILQGPGASGKSTFAWTLAKILGDYSRALGIETFTSKRDGVIPNDLAALHNARMVVTSEVPEGATLNEQLLKLMSGEDVMSARFMGGEFFDYVPQYKLWFLSNPLPGLSKADVAIMRRVRLVPFPMTIPEGRRDRDLRAKLLAEGPGILRWAVDGCRAWSEADLAPPAAVVAANAGYQIAMDVVGRFIRDVCVEPRPSASSPVVENSALYAAYTRWCAVSGETAMSHRALTQSLLERRHKQDPSRKDGKRWWTTLALAGG